MRKLTDQCDICAIDEHSELDTAGSLRLITVHSLEGVSTNLMSSKFTLSRIISSDTMTFSSARRFVSTLTLWLMWQLHIKRRRSTGQIPISTRCRRACDDFLVHWVIIRINMPSFITFYSKCVWTFSNSSRRVLYVSNLFTVQVT